MESADRVVQKYTQQRIQHELALSGSALKIDTMYQAIYKNQASLQGWGKSGIPHLSVSGDRLIQHLLGWANPLY